MAIGLGKSTQAGYQANVQLRVLKPSVGESVHLPDNASHLTLEPFTSKESPFVQISRHKSLRRRSAQRQAILHQIHQRSLEDLRSTQLTTQPSACPCVSSGVQSKAGLGLPCARRRRRRVEEHEMPRSVPRRPRLLRLGVGCLRTQLEEPDDSDCPSDSDPDSLRMEYESERRT